MSPTNSVLASPALPHAVTTPAVTESVDHGGHQIQIRINNILDVNGSGTMDNTQQSTTPALIDSTSGLPSGWERQLSPDGRPYYIDHNTRTTTWVDPANPYFGTGLPRGWERRLSPDGRPYYLDHNTRKTTWVEPTNGDLESLPDVSV
jgi:hypothetical protein